MKKTVSIFLQHDHHIILALRSRGQHYSGVLQSTAHGEIENEEGETEKQALARELEEETSLSLDMVKDLVELGEKKVGVRTKEECSYYTGRLPEQFYKLMHPCGEIQRFVRVALEDVKNIIPFSQVLKKIKNPEAGVNPDESMVMFDDEIEFLKIIFKKIKQTTPKTAASPKKKVNTQKKSTKGNSKK